MTHNERTTNTVASWLLEHANEAVLVYKNTTINEVADRLIGSHQRDAYVIDDDNHVLGHIGFDKIANHVLSEHRSTHTRRQLFARVTEPFAYELMNPHFIYAYHDELLCDVIHRQLDHGIEELVVIDRQTHEVFGIIKLRDVITDSVCSEQSA
jgi:predicted transcriptional regulator